MAKTKTKTPPMEITIKIHPRYAGKIIEGLAYAQSRVSDVTDDRITRACLRADYSIAADIVGLALGEQVAKTLGHNAWTRWLSARVIQFALSRLAVENPTN